jgi:hypothetical protein
MACQVFQEQRFPGSVTIPPSLPKVCLFLVSCFFWVVGVWKEVTPLRGEGQLVLDVGNP